MNPTDLTAIESLLPPRKEWFTVKDAARLLGWSYEHMRTCVDEGRLPSFISVGPNGRRSYRLHREHLRAYLLQNANFKPDDLVLLAAKWLCSWPRAQRAALRKLLDQKDRGN